MGSDGDILTLGGRESEGREGEKKKKKRNSVGPVVRHRLPRFLGRGNRSPLVDHETPLVCALKLGIDCAVSDFLKCLFSRWG